MGNLVCRLAVGGASCNPALLVDGRYFCNHIQFLGNAVNGFVRGGGGESPVSMGAWARPIDAAVFEQPDYTSITGPRDPVCDTG